MTTPSTEEVPTGARPLVISTESTLEEYIEALQALLVAAERGEPCPVVIADTPPD